MAPPASYMLRISRTYEQLTAMVAHIAEQSTRLVIYEHEADDEVSRTHIHCGIIDYKMSKATLENRLKELVPDWEGGNPDYSCKKWDGKQKYIVYMTKGRISPSFNKGYSDEDLEEAKSLWVDVKLSDAVIHYAKCLPDRIWAEDMAHVTKEHYDGMLENVKSTARRYAYEHAGRVWTLQAASMYKMLVSTWFFRANVPHRLKINSDI